METKWKDASEPSVTSEAITDALFSTNPKTRYPVASAGAFPAWLVVKWTRWILPDRFMDAAIRANYDPDRSSIKELLFSAQPGKRPKPKEGTPAQPNPSDDREL